jgi:hypothetical protein
MAELAAPPSLAEAGAWVGLGLDDVDGRPVGRIDGLYADAEGGPPAWLIVTQERPPRRFGLFGRRAAKSVAVPLRECAAMPGRAWTAQGREALRAAPTVDPGRPLLREHEIALCGHYGIGARDGRHAEVAARPAGSVTAQPA